MPSANGATGDTALLVLYSYTPNSGAAIVAVLFYALISIAVTAVTVKTRTWYMLLVPFTALLELAGESDCSAARGALGHVVHMCTATRAKL
jgi:hypothetical protein